MRNIFDGVAEFAAVADAGGFSAAARELGTSKSLLSQHVARLEQRLGVRLFHRNTRQLSLTEAGQLYRDRVRRVLDEAARAEGVVQELHGEPSGRVRVTASVLFASEHLAPALPSFWTRHPKVGVDIVADDNPRDLAGEAIDLAIRFGKLESPGAIMRRLAPLRRVLCASPAYLERQGVPTHPDDLRGHDCLFSLSMPSERRTEWIFHAPRGGGVVRVPTTGPAATDTGIVRRAMALAGCGVTRLPTANVGEDLRAGRLVEVLPDWPLASKSDQGVWAVYAGNRAIPPKVRAFVDFLAARIGDPPYWDEGLS